MVSEDDAGFLPDLFAIRRRVHDGLAYRPELSRNSRRFWRPERRTALADAVVAQPMADFLFPLVQAPVFAHLGEQSVHADAYAAWLNGETDDVLSIMHRSYLPIGNTDLLNYVIAATQGLDVTLAEVSMFGDPVGQDFSFDVGLQRPSERLRGTGYEIGLRAFNSHRGSAAMRLTLAIMNRHTGVALTGIPWEMRGERLPPMEWSFTHVGGLTKRIERFVRHGHTRESADYLADLALRLIDIEVDHELVVRTLHEIWPMPALPPIAVEHPKPRRDRYQLVGEAFPGEKGSLLDLVHAFAFYLDECSQLGGEAASNTFSADLLIRRHRAVVMDKAGSRKRSVWNAAMRSVA